MFDLIEDRINRAAMAKLANAVAVLNGVDMPVIFDEQYKRGNVGMIGMGAQAPQMIVRNDVIADSWISAPFTIRQTGKPDSQWIVQDTEPDTSSSGMTTVILRKA